MDEITEIVQNSTRDRVALAALKSIQNNQVLRSLVGESEAVSFRRMKTQVRDYAGLDWTKGLDELTQAFQNITQGPESRRLINTAAVNLHLFIDMMTHMMDASYLVLINQFVGHQRSLLRLASIPEGQYRDLLLSLHHDGFLDHAGPAFAVCQHCPNGTITTLRTTVLSRRIRCPLCGHASAVMTTLRPTGALRQALNLGDGFIGGSIGWFLQKRGINFRHGLKLSDGTEIDFLAEDGTGWQIIECKAHKRESALKSTLREDWKQLISHSDALRNDGMKVAGAIGVSNLMPEEIEGAIPPRPATSFNVQLISYQDFPGWVDQRQFVVTDQ